MLNVFDATYEFTYSKSYSDTVHQETLIEGYTAISRNVVRKNVHATIPKGNMEYGQYTDPDLLSCRTYFCCFPLALTNILSRPLVPFF